MRISKEASTMGAEKVKSDNRRKSGREWGCTGLIGHCKNFHFLLHERRAYRRIDLFHILKECILKVSNRIS